MTPGVEDTDFLLLYRELRGLAEGYLRRERPDHTLQATALVHETWERLERSGSGGFQDRHHFLATAARVMRRILVDYARSRRAAKRGGGRARVRVDVHDLAASQGTDPDAYLVALDEALVRLDRVDHRAARLVELRFFAGLSMEEAAGVLDVSPATAHRDWAFARTWLHREITRHGES